MHRDPAWAFPPICVVRHITGVAKISIRDLSGGRGLLPGRQAIETIGNSAFTHQLAPVKYAAIAKSKNCRERLDNYLRFRNDIERLENPAASRPTIFSSIRSIRSWPFFSGSDSNLLSPSRGIIIGNSRSCSLSTLVDVPLRRLGWFYSRDTGAREPRAALTPSKHARFDRQGRFTGTLSKSGTSMLSSALIDR